MRTRVVMCEDCAARLVVPDLPYVYGLCAECGAEVEVYDDPDD